MSPRILLVEDNVDLAAGIRYNLEREGYEVVAAENGADALALARGTTPDLVILDLMLPGMDGFAVLQELRRTGMGMPVLVLTARCEEVDKVRAFRLDADQYVTKPFGLLELLERVKMLLRRRTGGGDAPAGGRPAPAERIRFGDIEVDVDARRVCKRGAPVALSPKSFELLLALLRREGHALARHDLLREVWGHLGRVQTRTVDWHISELRGKLEDDPENPRHIHTVWKVGYRFER
jgi:DNA-binding response OmpR family regulator